MGKWITTWAQAHVDMGLMCGNYKNHTVKITIVSCLCGNQIRLRLSNQEGKKPVHILQIGLQSGNGGIVPMTVGGKRDILLEPKQSLYTDAAELPVTEGMDITVSMAFEGQATSGNQISESVRYSKKGNYALQRQMPAAKKGIRDTIYNMSPVIPVLSGIEVLTVQEKDVLVCFGDSITQQSHWTKPLGKLLRNTVVINKGIGGNQLLSDPMSKFMSMWGPKAVSRFCTDVLEETGVTGVIFALGTNDIGMTRDWKQIEEHGAQKLMEALLELNKGAKTAGLKTYIATITPRGASTGYQPWHEKERLALNKAIRESTAFDGVIDFDAVTRDSTDPALFDEPCDSGDHLHPGAIGGMRMAKEAFRVLDGEKSWGKNSGGKHQSASQMAEE